MNWMTETWVSEVVSSFASMYNKNTDTVWRVKV